MCLSECMKIICMGGEDLYSYTATSNHSIAVTIIYKCLLYRIHQFKCNFRLQLQPAEEQLIDCKTSK